MQKYKNIKAIPSQSAITSGYTAQDDRDDINVFFVHKELDDLGLDPYSFRIYARILRRAGKGEAFESNKNMAAGCRMSEKQVKRSLAVLVQYGLITKESRPGTTCIYRVAPKRNWSSPIPPDSKTSTDNPSRPTEGCELVKDDTQTCTDRSGRPTEGYVSVVDDTNSCTDRSGRPRGVGLTDLGGGSGRPRGVGLPDPLSNSLLSTSHSSQSLLSDGLEEKAQEQEQEQEQASKQDPIIHVDASFDQQTQDPATTSKPIPKDQLSGAARESHSQNLQNLTFSENPLAEPQFLGYYKTYMKSQRKIEIANAHNYASTALSNNDGGDAEVICLYDEWKAACRTLERKISNFADDPRQVEEQRKRFDFASWESDKHRGYYSRLLMEGLKKFCEHDLSAKWYAWAIATHPERFTDEIPA